MEIKEKIKEIWKVDVSDETISELIEKHKNDSIPFEDCYETQSKYFKPKETDNTIHEIGRNCTLNKIVNNGDTQYILYTSSTGKFLDIVFKENMVITKKELDLLEEMSKEHLQWKKN